MTVRARLQSPGGAALVVFVLCLAFFLPTAARTTTHIDVDHAGVAGWRIAETGAPWMDDMDVDGFAEKHDFEPKFIGPAPNGHTLVHRSPGVVASAVPAYWLAPGDDFSTTPQALWAALITALSMAVLCLALARRVSPRTAAASALVVALTTPVWTICANGLWTHTITLLGLVTMAWAAERNRWVAAGLAGGLALWGRVHMTLVVAVVGLGVAVGRRQPGIALRVGGASAACLALASLWSYEMYGRWAPTGGYVASDVASRVATGDGESSWGQLTNQLGMWIAPDRGVLVWTPLLVVLAPAVVRAWGELPDWSRWLLVGGLVYTLGQASYSPFYGGDGLYGYRLGLEFLACAVPAYVFSLPRAGALARQLLGPTIAFQFAVISLGAVIDPLALGENTAWTHHVFVSAASEVPVLWAWLIACVAIGALAQRALTQRALAARAPSTAATR